MNNILPFYISAADITMYSNIAFFVIIGLIVIGFLVGLAKGVWKKTFSLVCTIGLALTLVLCIKPLSNFIYNYDVSSIVQNFSLELPEGSGDFKTLGELLQNLINHYLESSEVQIEMTPDMIQFVDGLAHSIIQLAAFIVGAILIILIFLLICPLLYHLLFKWIVPKDTRKHHKLRFLGGVEGLIEITCILSLVLMPFTGIANSILSGIRDEKGNIQVNEDNDNEIYQLVCDILNGYNESVLASSLFKITLNGKPIDVTLMNYITESNLNDTTKLELLDELKILSSVAFDALSKELVDFTANTVNLSVILQSEFVTDSLHKLADSSLICSALPIALLVGLNYSGDMMDVDFSKVDLSNIDWSNSLVGVGDTFHEIQQSGIITEEIIESPELLMDKVKLNREHETELKSALNILFNSSFIDELMPQIAVSILDSRRETPKSDVSVKRSNGSDSQDQDTTGRFLDFSADLPDQAYDVETYKSIDWGKELSDMLEIVLRVSEQYTHVYGEELNLSQINKLFNGDVLMNSLFGINDDVVYETEEDYKNNIFLNGGEINNSHIYGSKRIVGSTNETENVGLLDLQFVQKLLVDFNILPEIIPDIVDSLEGKEQIGDVNEACDRLTNEISTWKIEDWKDEFNSLLEASVPLMNSTKFINEDDELQTLRDFSAGEGNFALVYFSDKIESSFLLNEVAPLLLKAYTTNPENDMELALGLKLSDLNFTKFDDSSFAKEMHNIAKDVLPNSESIINLAEEENVDIKKIIHDRDGLENALEAIYSNQIVNPHLTKEQISAKELSNFENVMINLLCDPAEEGITNGTDTSLNIPTMTDNLVCVKKNSILKVGKDGNKNWVEKDGEGEIHYLFDTLVSLEATKEGDTEYILSYINGDESINMEEKVYEMGNEVERIFATVDNSVLMKDAFPSTLNKVLKENEVGKFADFNKVENWEKEGIYFSDTLDKVNELKKSDSKSDIATILKDCDKDLLREYQFVSPEHQEDYNLYNGEYYRYFEANSNSYELLHSLYKTQSIDLPTVLYDTVKDILTSKEDGNQPIFSEENNNMNKIIDAEDDFKFDSNSIKYNSDLFVNWDYKNKKPEYRGELYNMARLFVYSKSLDDIDNIESEEEFDEILSVVNLSYPIRNIIGDMIQDSLRKVSGGSSSETIKSVLSGDYADYDAFSRLDFKRWENDDITNRLDEIEKRRIEIDALCALDSRRKDFEELNDKFDSTVNELTKINESTHVSKLIDLLNKLHKSELFNSSNYISSMENGKRNKITSFENIYNTIFNMKKDIFDEVPNSIIYSLNNRKDNDKWIGEKGEIVNFNNAIYESIHSDLYTKIISANPDDKLSEIKTLYKTGNPSFLNNLTNSLKKSIMLEYQLPTIYDKYVYGELKANSQKFEKIDNTYLLAETPYRSFYNKGTLISWENESNAMDGLFNVIADSDISCENPSNVESKDISALFDAIENSTVLTYDRDYNPLLGDKLERNYYEYNVCLFDSYIKNELIDKDIFEIKDVNKLGDVKQHTNTSDIVDYGSEKDFIVNFVGCYDQLTGKAPNDKLGGVKFKFLGSDDTQMVDLKSLDQSHINALADILNNMNNALNSSTVFNYRTLNADRDYFKEKGDRTIYEHSIIHLSNKIRDAIVNSYNFSTENDKYDIDYSTSDKLVSLHQFEDEQDALINIVNSYGSVVDALNEELSIKNISNNTSSIYNFYETVSYSQILNHTNNDKVLNVEGETLSIYDDMVLYLIDKINNEVYSSISLGGTYITISEIKRNPILSTQDIYDSEVNLILNENGIIDIINRMELEGKDDVKFDINYINDKNKQSNLLALLECFEESYSFNYTRGGYAGRIIDKQKTSTFEDICIKIFNQDSFTGKIYDNDNMMQNQILNGLNGELTDKAVVKYKVMSINDHDPQNIYINNIRFMTDQNNTDQNTGEINKLFDLFGDISDDEVKQRLDFSDIEESKEILKEIGKIYILHDIEPKLIKDISLKESIKEPSTVPQKNKLNSLNDITYRSADFYYYEYSVDKVVNGNTTYKYNYEVFSDCAESYIAEIDTINNMLKSAKDANISGELTEENKNPVMFKNLLTNIDKSNIFRNIYSELVVKILSNIYYSYSDVDHSLDQFILSKEEISKIPEGTDILLIEIEAFEANFTSNKDVEKLYENEGASLDSFISYIINKSGVESNQLIGQIMISNFKIFLEGLGIK